MEASGVYTMVVKPTQKEPMTLEPAGPEPGAALPEQTEGEEVNVEIKVAGGVPPYTLAPVEGLPPGVTASLEGNTVYIKGVPSVAGTATFDVKVDDSQ